MPYTGLGATSDHWMVTGHGVRIRKPWHQVMTGIIRSTKRPLDSIVMIEFPTGDTGAFDSEYLEPYFFVGDVVIVKSKGDLAHGGEVGRVTSANSDFCVGFLSDGPQIHYGPYDLILVARESALTAAAPKRAEAPCPVCCKTNDIGVLVCWCCGGSL